MAGKFQACLILVGDEGAVIFSVRGLNDHAAVLLIDHFDAWRAKRWEVRRQIGKFDMDDATSRAVLDVFDYGDLLGLVPTEGEN